MHGMVGDAHRADDLAQEAWVRVVRGLPRLREPARFPAWVFTLARRVVVDELRQAYRQPVLDVGADGLIDAPAVDDVRHLLDRVDLAAALARLSPIDREAVVLFHLLDQPLAVVTTVLDVPAGTVKSRLNRARRQLRAHLDDQECS